MPPKPALNVRFLGGFLLLSTLVALGFAGGYRNLRSDVAATLESNLRQRVGEVSRSLTSARGFYLERVQGTMRVLQQTALAAGSPAAGDWVDVEGRAVRDVRFGPRGVAGRTDLVDATTAMLGGTATIFTRVGDDFLRLTTNVRRADGSRAVGTVLDAASPALVALRRGESYYGVVGLFGRSYLTGYEPIRDAKGEVIGVFYVGYLIEALDQISRLLAETTLLKQGFVVLVDREGRSIFPATGPAADLLPKAVDRLARHETGWTEGEWSWRAEAFPQWQFTLLAAVNQRDIDEATWSRVLPVFGFMIPLISGALGLGYFFARRLARALGQAEQLREEGRKLALVASRTYNGVLITGPTGKIEWVNAAFTRLTGYSAEEAIGRHPDDFLMGPDTSAETLAEKKRARQEQRGFQLEILNYHKSGRPIWILVDGQPVLDEQGSVANYVTVQVDISKRKKIEDDLLVAREAAEEANRTKSAFLANMSHELRTPMNAIIGYSEMLVEEAEDLGQESFIPDLKKIHGAGRHLLGLINDVLDLSKIEAGKMTLYLEDFEVAAMVKEAAATVEPLIGKNTNQLAVTCAADLGSMRADVTKVRQTLFNLLSNAAKFTHAGTITLAVERVRHGEIDCIAFRVTDTGIGMTPEQVGRLFGAFVQADASTTRKYGGTGLGLAISRKFCILMGGDILVRSEVGRGTTFTALVPERVIDPAAAAPLPSASDAPAEVVVAPGTGYAPLVLVVDDDPAVVDLISRSLGKEGYRVQAAANGRDALALARKLQPQLITLDVMMPSMDGWSVLTALKAEPATRAIPVVMISIVDDKQLGFALGAADYLTKPVDRARLTEILARRVGRDRERHVLVVDDLPDNRALLRRALEQEGWTVTEAENGRAGLEAVANHAPALVLLDLMMPVMDGFEFLRELRARPEGRMIPVVVVTAKELTAAERDMLRSCVENIVQKGALAPEEILAEIRAKILPAEGPAKAV
ncbi:MAG: response regulator [Verrucomicrobiota bacterium]